MNTATDDAIDWVRDRMPTESAAAIAQFVARNPHYQGANWDDVLEILLDADADLQWTEPIHEVDESFPANPLESAVATTLAWAQESFINELIPADRVGAVRDLITINNGEQRS